MKTSWDIIGDIVLGLMIVVFITFAIYITLGIVLRCLVWLHALSRHKQTRDIPIAAGQNWTNGKHSYRIGHIHDNGVLVIHPSRNVSWGENPDTWRKRVINEKLWLTNPPQNTHD